MANRAQDPRDTYRWKQTRKAILSTGPACEYCGEPATCVDHRVPLSRGGDPFDPANLAPSCRACNLSRRYEPTANPEPGAAEGTGPGVVITHGLWGVN